MRYEMYTTGTGQKLPAHHRDDCSGQYCPIHNPSNHPLKDCPTHWRNDLGIMERICKHGVGHPDPDDLKVASDSTGEYSTHGCCGCCGDVYNEPFENSN